MKLFSGLGMGQACTVQLEFKGPGGGAVETVSVNKGGAAGRRDDPESMPLYSNKDTVAGEVKVTPIPGKRVDHQGIRVQLLGEVELAAERGHPHEFLSLVRDLAPPGDLATQACLPFEFANVEMQHESYRGLQVRLRYLLRVTVSRGMGSTVTRDFPFWVRNCDEAPSTEGPPIKMEVGIEDCLHIEFEYDKAAYHLRDVVVGHIYFLLVRIRLKHMELEVRRRETTGAGAAARSESETLAKYEIMDGAPARGEGIPIRLFLSPYDLTPSYKGMANRFSVRYFLNLVLVDEEDRRYFKQQEITLYRLPENTPAAAGTAAFKPARLLSTSSGVPPPAAAAAPAAPFAAPTAVAAQQVQQQSMEEPQQQAAPAAENSGGNAAPPL